MNPKFAVGNSQVPALKLLGLIGITLLAALFRLYRIDSLPPGDGHDPALYGLDALAILEGEHPIFFASNFGREALFSYLVAACSAVLGASTLAIHVSAAIVGILTVPAVYLLADEMFSTEGGTLARFGGLVAALTLALSYWHLNWSRYGARAILVPLLAALTVQLLCQGLRTGSRWSFVGCGLCLGLSMYTYQAARLLPVLVLSGCACAVWSARSFSKENGLNLAIVLATALVVFAPLGFYFLAHPSDFTQRIEQTLVLDTSRGLGDNVRALLSQVTETLLMFSVRGDNEAFCNVPFRPALSPVLSMAFYLGIAVSLLRIRRPPYLFLLIWLGLMSTPAMLAQLGPAGKRALGTLPAVALLIASGLLVPYDALRRWAACRSVPWSKALGLVLLIGIGSAFAYTGCVTYRDYFITWGQDPNLFTHLEVGLSAIGEYVGELPREEQVYLSPVPPEHPTIVLHSRMRQNLKGYNGRVCLVLPERTSHDTTYVIVPGEDGNSLDLLPKHFPEGEIVHQGPLHFQQPYFLAYRIPAGTEVRVAPSHRLEVNWDNRIGLLGYDLDTTTYQAGETIHLTLYYQGLEAMKTDYTVFTHLLGPYNPSTEGPLWGQDDSEPCRRCYPTSRWDAGEIVIDEFTIPIPPDAPQGGYQLAMGLYQWPTLERLPVLDAAGQTATDDVVILGQIWITL